ncbi:MAG: hypothetical protein QOF09_4648 [Alphaproteobacteria bacterium]|jgi:hypothetical protein|nr:hypothetical protein [Alphaproteobacteria bacterium]
MLVRALTTILGLALGGCTVSGLLPDWTSPDVAGPEPAYRFVIANGLAAIVGDPAKAGTFQISGARRVDSLKGASWVVCIKIQNFPLLPRYYAVFLQSERVVDSRLSVLIDQCELQSYSPFDWIADSNAPPVR